MLLSIGPTRFEPHSVKLEGAGLQFPKSHRLKRSRKAMLLFHCPYTSCLCLATDRLK